MWSNEGSSICYLISCSLAVGYEGEDGKCSCMDGYNGVVQYVSGSLSGCSPCGAGYYCNELEKRIACPKGTYSSETTASAFSTCNKCNVGTFNPNIGGGSVSSCNQCPSGMTLKPFSMCLCTF